MNAPMSNPADCEVRGVIRFLQAEKLDPVKSTEDLLHSTENGAQCLGMGEQMFMTMRDQGDPLLSQTH